MAYVKNATWATGDIITATKLNNLETQYDQVKTEVEKIDGTSAIQPDWSNIKNKAHKSTHATGGTDPLTPEDIGAATASHTHSDATTSVSGFMSATDKSKLNGIASGAEVNQNAFSNVKVGATTIAADIKTDTLEFVAGSGITLTPDATNDKLTIAASGATIASGSYTGDSADGRTITVGFTPKVVFITRTGTGASGSNSSISEIYMFNESAAYMGDSTDTDNVVRSYAQDSMGKIVTNGFTVSFTRRTNVESWTYGWVALV